MVEEKLPRVLGPYVLEAFIAEGGMARVYRARRTDGALPSVQVVKLMQPRMAEDQGEAMFRDEARLARQLVHPNIVRLYDFGDVNGDLYMAMELVDGPSISQLVRGLRGPIAPRTALLMTIQLCEALQYAHTAKDADGRPLALVHRDVSPQNVLLTRTGVLKLADFGIAKVAFGREARTTTNYVKGKVGYMSPEQLLGRGLDHRSDQFGAAIVLWEMLCGARLFREKTDALNIQKVIYGQPERPSAINRYLPGALDDVILVALEKDPGKRYPDMHAFARALRAALTRFPAGPDDSVALLIARVTGQPLPVDFDVSVLVDAAKESAADGIESQMTLKKPNIASDGGGSHGPPSVDEVSDHSAPTQTGFVSAGKLFRPTPEPLSARATAEVSGKTGRPGSQQTRTRHDDTALATSHLVGAPRGGIPALPAAGVLLLAALTFALGMAVGGREPPDACGTISTEPKKIDAAYDLALEAQRAMEAGNLVQAVDKANTSIASSSTGKAHFVIARTAFFEHRTQDAFFHLMCTARLDPQGDEVRWALEQIRRRD